MNSKILSGLALSALLCAAAPVFAGDASLGLGVKVGDTLNVDANAKAKKEAAAKKEEQKETGEQKAAEASAKVEEKKEEAKAKTEEHKEAATESAHKGKRKLKAGIGATTGTLKSATDVNVDVKAGASAESDKK